MQPHQIPRWRSAWRAAVPALRRCSGFLPSVAVLALAGLVVIGASCTSVNRTVVAPPKIAGATFMGSESCAQCHEKIAKDFVGATHSRLKAEGPNAATVGCESCHGPASLHNESGGARGTIVNPRRSPDTCYHCHLEIQAAFRLPNHHPVPEGKVSCADCHNPHKGNAIIGGGTAMGTEADTCGRCHIAQRGPFTFEHEAVREGCSTCHQPHGSVNARLLTERNQILCLKCHFQEQKSGGIWIGGQEHSSRLARGTCWSGGCHEAVHGSHVGSSLRF
jgi:predicted CXXCH cytochrome family protein